MKNKDETVQIITTKKVYDMLLLNNFSYIKSSNVAFIGDKKVQITMSEEAYGKYYTLICMLKASGFGAPYYDMRSPRR